MADANVAGSDEQKSADAQQQQAKSYSEEEFKKVVAERQEAKAKLKEFESRLQAFEQEKQKQAEKELTKDQLIAQREKELEAVKAEKERIEAEASVFREKQAALKNQLLAKIQDGDLKKVAEKLDVEDIQLLIEKNTKFNGTSKGSLDTNKTPTFKNFAEWEAYAKQNGLIS